MYFWPHWVFIGAHGLFIARRGLSLAVFFAVHGLLLEVALLFWSAGSRVHGLW